MRTIPFPWRILIVLGLILGLGTYAFTHLRIEQDIVASLEKSRPEEAALFHSLQGSGFFQDQIYIKILSDRVGLKEELAAALHENGYEFREGPQTKIDDPSELYALLPFLDKASQARLFSGEHRAEIIRELRATMNAPGGLGILRLLNRDPLLLSREMPRLMHLDRGTEAPLAARRLGDMDWEKTRALYTFMKANDKDLSFLGGDFFALENYDAVHHDIWIGSILSTVLSLIVFRYFCRQWSLLLFLLLGTLLSSVTALIFAEAQYGALYGLVLAFASTFVSFNNESLVHLSGIHWQKPEKGSLIAVISAIGTTVIGFLVLLLSSSQLTKQLALLSLGSLFGFLAFLWLFRDKLEGFQFRSLSLPQFTWRKPQLMLGAGIVLLAILVLPKPSMKTKLEEFRFATPYLEEQTARFSKIYQSFSFEALHAVPKRDWAQLQRSGAIDKSVFHPLNLFLGEIEQDRQRESLNHGFTTQIEALRSDLEKEGLRSDFNRGLLPQKSLTRSQYLNLWQKIWPLPWESKDHLLVFLKQGEEIAGAVPMHPKAFYESILNDLSHNLGKLFCLGLFVMLLYLIPWQKRFDKILLIFLPLLVSLLVLQLLFLLTHRNLSILHIMGLALVISVALDYGSVLVSTDHDPKEQGKVVLTGGLTLAAFGSLLFAKHPVLHELALVVTLGTLVSWTMALFTRIPSAGGES